MKALKKRNLFWIIPLLILLIINFSGCLQMRDSDRKIAKKLAKKHLIARFHNYTKGTQTIHYWDISNPDKPIVLFVHGSPGSSMALMGIATDTFITANFMPVLVDRPGFGYSNFGHAESSFARQSELLDAVLKSYPNQRKILVGHSLGGPIIVKMAMDFPDEIDAIVILAGSIDPALEPYEWHRKPMSSKFIRWMIPKAFTASNDEILTTKAELTKMLPDWEKIKIPIIVIQGTKDGFVPKENADFAKRMAKKAQVKLRMLPGQSHFFPFTKPEIVMEELMLLR
jgi:pimeloyl-ACP methyl ester carboxylesterase